MHNITPKSSKLFHQSHILAEHLEGVKSDAALKNDRAVENIFNNPSNLTLMYFSQSLTIK